MALPRTLTRHPDLRDLAVGAGADAWAGVEARPTGEARGTALLLPGFTGSKEDFLPLLPLLAAGGVRAVAVDLRGQYESPHADRPEGYAVEQLAAEVAERAASLGDGPVHLLGHSFGGLVAQEAARAAPGALASLTLLCTGPGALPPGARTDDAELLLAALPGVPLDQAWELKQAHEAAGAPAPGTPAPEVQEFLQRRWVRSAHEGYLVMARELVSRPDTVDELAAVLRAAGVPVLVAHGADDDAWTPEQQADMARRLGARYVVVPDAAHSPAYEAPEATARVLLGHWLGA
ncbi:pimeloyl-ACP methyl ester carboxylesterase [Motilibacter peucedani]|uniref:Pimeloyl-ACP methyl ester carboxylesterase n=1 Tax=Motilibacter peucedani TaxID=598650 RepID=A0A420XMK7_9ACTN|nr:alpha/beta hydrolase [Motilibacter peucedani]RKS72502.1 pimeloyl-ACP methyl ester carboxylesterase [Motilibacter peucedani]